MKNIFLSLFIVLTSICSYSQEKKIIAKGEVIDLVKVEGAINESYAVYLPKQYNEKVPSAIVFIFDPGARGVVGIEPFVLAAETYNYILVCSNNSKNGPTDINIEITNRLFDSVLSTYNLDPSQLYLSGFSGGARLAGSIAVSSTAFQGVIACGASFNGMDKFALQNSNFSYVGMVGDKDMNYQEMIQNREWLDKMMMKNTLFISHDTHTWPMPKQMLRAFDWLQIQAFKKNIRKTNEAVIKKIYDKNLKIADSLKVNNELIQAVVEYGRCNVINDNKDVKATISEIKKSKEYKEQIRKNEEIAVLEGEIGSAILEQFDKELKVAKSDGDFKFWKNEFKKLENRKLKSDDVQIKNMVDRLQFMTKAMVYQTAQESKRNVQNDKLFYCNELEKVLQLYMKE